MEQVNRLLVAARKGNLEVLSNLLDRGTHVDSSGGEGINALHMAAANGREDTVRLLLSRGASLEARTLYGWTALMFAAYYGHLRVTVILLRHTKEIDATNHLGATALFSSARSGHAQIVAQLLDAGASVNGECVPSSSDDDARLRVSPLMTAAQHGHEEVVSLLVKNRANVNYREPSTGWTALMLAALNGRMGVVEILIANEADVNQKNVTGDTALTYSGQNTEVERFLGRMTTERAVHTQGPRLVKLSIMELAKTGDTHGLKLLLQEGERDQINAIDEDGASPLMYAAMSGHYTAVQLLIEHNSKLDFQERNTGWTALMQATYYRHRAVVKLLIDSGADVNVRAKNGCTAFEMASIIGDTEILRLLASATISSSPASSTNLSQLSLLDSKEKWWSTNSISSRQNPVNGHDSDVPEAPPKNWWSKMSSRFRHLVSTKTKALEPGMGFQVHEVLTPEELDQRYRKGSVTGETDLMVTKRSLTSVLDPAVKVNGRKLKRTQALAVVTQRTQLPDDMITPVVPPSMRTAAFEFTPVQQREPHSPDTDGMNILVPSLCINGKTVPEQYLLHRLDNLSIVSSNRRRESRHAFTGSPDSSYSSSSAVSSNSTNSGSKTLKASSTTATDIPLFSGMRSPLQQQSERHYFSPSPTSLSSLSAGLRSHHRPQSNSSTCLTGPTIPLHHQHSGDMSSCPENEENLGEILEKLSLEKYNTIFEEQEIDMEAFLTLNDGDLVDLGITQKGARMQILETVAELNCGKAMDQSLHLAVSTDT